jgi:mono/diheme cytochrome c family protein
MGGNFLALESATGKLLLKTATGGALAGGVITYALGGKQYVALTSGNVSRMSFGEGGKPTLILYALADGARSEAPAPAQQSAAPTVPTTVTAAAAPPDAGRGKELFGKNCAACHGRSGEGGSGPALKGIRTRLDVAATINWIENPSAKMPRLYPSTLDAQAVVDIAAYVQGF